jgi:hypothetical protein
VGCGPRTMNHLLAQMTLASRGDDVDGWMNILFVVILAVFWAVAGIVKAKARKSQPEDEDESAGQPARRPQARRSSLREQLLKQFYGPAEPTEREPSGPGPQQQDTRAAGPPGGERAYAEALRRAVPRHAPESERAGTLPAAEPLPELESILPDTQAQPEIESLPEFRGNLVTDLAVESLRAPAEPPQAKDLAEILLDYADPEELRRAILHYEILGRPLSLRDSSAYSAEL